MAEEFEPDSELSQPWTPMLEEDVSPDIKNILQAVLDEVPQLPVHVHKLIRLVSEPDSDSHEVSQLAASDPAMVSKILKAVNSSFYGLSKKVDNLHLAIIVLGFHEVRKIAIQSGFAGIFGEGWIYKGYDTHDLWEHSYLVSVCAEALSKKRNPRNAGRMLTMGILHDIGKYALFKLAVLMKKRHIKPPVGKRYSPRLPILEKEEILFGINHPVVGSLLAKKWDLSENIGGVLAYHHHPSYLGIDTIPEEYREDVIIISMADILVNTITSKSKGLPEPPAEYFDFVGFEPSIEKLATEELRTAIDDAKEFLVSMK